MTPSITVPFRVVSTDIVDTTEEFVTTMQRNFASGCEMRFGNYIYRNVGDTIKIPTYSAENEYAVGDIAFKDGYIQKVYADSGLTPKQPEEYLAVDTSKDSSAWVERYVLLFSTFTDGDTYTVGSDKYTFYDNVADGGFVVQIVENTTTGEQWAFEIKAESAVTVDSNEVTPEIYASAFYRFGYFVKRGNALYARTSVSPTVAEIEWNAPTEAAFLPISHITELTGFVEYKPTNAYAPADAKNYSSGKRAGSLTYTIKAFKRFDTVAVHCIASTIDVVFKNSAGTTVYSKTGHEVDSSRDTSGRLEGYKATEILYSSADIPAGGTPWTERGCGVHKPCFLEQVQGQIANERRCVREPCARRWGQDQDTLRHCGCTALQLQHDRPPAHVYGRG